MALTARCNNRTFKSIQADGTFDGIHYDLLREIASADATNGLTWGQLVVRVKESICRVRECYQGCTAHTICLT